MSFNITKFFMDRGNLGSIPTLGMPAMHRYGSADDTIATITTSAYFNDLIPPQYLPTQPNISGSLNENYIEIGDFILVKDSTNETTLIQITAVTPNVTTSQSAVDIPDGSITAAKLAAASVITSKLADESVELAKLGTTVYSTNNLAGSFSGPFAAPVSGTVNYRMCNNNVLVDLPAISSTSTTAAIMTYSLALPVGFRPAADILNHIYVTDNSGSVSGIVKVSTAGVITIGVSGALSAFANTGNAGIAHTPIWVPLG